MRLTSGLMAASALFALVACEGYGPTALTSPDINWRFPLSSLFFGDPSADSERIFLVDRDRLIAIDKMTGAETWHFQSPHGPIGTEAIPISGDDIFLYTNQVVYALDAATGNLSWSTQLDRFWSGAFLGGATAIGNQQVYAVAFGGAVYALNKSSGLVNWYTELSPQPTKGIESSGLFCIGSDAQDEEIPAGVLSCLSVENGEVVWQQELPQVCIGGGISGHPIVADGLIIIGDHCGQLIAFDLMTGIQVWLKKYNTAFDADLVIDGNVGYACLRTSRCMAFSLATGDPLWQSPLSASAIEAPTVANGILWVTDLSGSLFQFEASSGVPVTRIDPADGGAVFFSRPIVDREAVYSGGGAFFYAIARP